MRREVLPHSLCCPEQFSTPMIMSEKHARDKPRRVNMQARAASPARTGSLPEASYTSPHTPHVPLTAPATFVSTLPSFVNTFALQYSPLHPPFSIYRR